jgi:rod shape determining protein RodA
MTPLFRKLLGMHWLLLLTMLLITAGGIYGIYAAVHFRDGDLVGLKRLWYQQMTIGLFGLVVYFAAGLIDYKWIKWGGVIAYVVGLVLLVLLFRAEKDTYGQKISLTLGPVTFQPAQIAISGSIMLIAMLLGEAHKFIPWMRHYFVRFVVGGIVFAIPFMLILKLGDLGSAMVMVPVVACMFLVASIPFRCLIATMLLGLTVIPPVYFFVLKPYQRDRVAVTLDMLAGKEVDVKGRAYAANHVQIAIGSAGYEGKGLDEKDLPPNQKNMTQLNLVPFKTAHNDFIFAVICEAFGFRGAAALIAAFSFMLALALMVAFFARDALGRLLATGIIALVFAHTFEHIGMNMGLLPITGIPLPLVSYGGTFLLITMFLLGLLQSVWVHRGAMAEETLTVARTSSRPRNAPAYS